MDKKILWMGIAGLMLVVMMLGCGGLCAYAIGRLWTTHTNEVDSTSP
jgi:hypothetical protein